MWLTNRVYCDFVVYLPNETSIERFPYNEPYVQEFLLPRGTQFYFGKYLPLLIAKQKGWLLPGQCTLPEDVQVEYFRPEVENK